MKLDLRKDVNKEKKANNSILLDERLPDFINKPIEICFTYEIERYPEYYLLNLHEKATIELVCQRCSDIWQYEYSNVHKMAVLLSEKNIGTYESLFDVIVSPDLTLDIKEIILDNMHLFLPEKHENVDHCNQDQLKLLGSD